MFVDTAHTSDFIFGLTEEDPYIAENSVCMNAVCSCPVVEPGTFCSEHCREIGDVVEVTCDCDHSSCVSAVFDTETAASALVN